MLGGAARRGLGGVYRAGAAPIGRRRLARMLRAGLPPPFELPLAVLFGAPAPSRARAMAATIEAARADIARLGHTYMLEYAPSGRHVRVPVRAAGAELTSARLAKAISVQERWGMFLHLCAEAWGARTILELGTCVGISGSYLASTSVNPRLVTLDGAADLVPIAEATLARITDRARVVVGRFDETLAPAIAPLMIDLAYVDGHHDGEATCSYVHTISSRLTSGALVILDDIRLYAEMWEAWRMLSSLAGVAAAVDVGRFGLLVWAGGDATATHHDLSPYTGWWSVGPPRRAGRGRFGAAASLR